MPGRSTLVVLAVGAVCLAATLDALTRGPSARPARAVAAAPLHAHTAGVLYFTDATCRLRALRLWNMRPQAAPALRRCRFSLSPDGLTPAAETTVWQPQGRLRATPEPGSVRLGSSKPPWAFRFAGATPAFRPDGTLTFTRGGALWEWTTDCVPNREVVSFSGDYARGRCARIVLPPRDLRGGEVVELAWLSNTRFAAILRSRSGDRVALFEGARRLRVVKQGRGRLSRLRASPGGSFLAASTATGGVLVLDRDGERFTLASSLTGFHAVAWSPDDRWMAVAGARSIFIFPSDRRTLHLVRVPLRARDLAWR